jgi:hypothetical protein
MQNAGRIIEGSKGCLYLYFLYEKVGQLKKVVF